MLKIFKREKKIELVAPIDGNTVALSAVPDKVFASGMMGKGIAVEPAGNVVVAPCAGKLTLLPDSKHAFGMKAVNGAEILVHIGLDTVNLKGSGFEALAHAGDKVDAGTPIIKFDRDFIEQKGYHLVTMLLVTNSSDYDVEIGETTRVTAGKTAIVTVTK